jgi:serine/threonine-protein kinase ATR
LKLAAQRDTTPEALLSPYWRDIAVAVAYHLHHRPQTAQLLSDLIGKTVSEFLVATQIYTLPWLIFSRKHETLKRIVQARSDGSTVWSICYEKDHLPAILAFLLVQTTQEQEGAIIALLVAAAPGFGDGEGLNNLLIQDSIPIAIELLMIAADTEEQNMSKVFGLEYVNNN